MILANSEDKKAFWIYINIIVDRLYNIFGAVNVIILLNMDIFKSTLNIKLNIWIHSSIGLYDCEWRIDSSCSSSCSFFLSFFLSLSLSVCLSFFFLYFFFFFFFLFCNLSAYVPVVYFSFLKSASDPIPTWLLEKCTSELAPFLCRLFNASK